MAQGPRNYHSSKPIDSDRIVAALQALGDLATGVARKIDSTYYDTFDWRLFESGRSLAVRREPRGSEIDLFEHGSPEPVATLPGGLPTGFVSDLPAGDIRSGLQPVIDVRRLLPRLAFTSTVLPISLLDDEGKIVLRLRVEQVACRRPDGGEDAVAVGTRVILLPVRGYGKQLRDAGCILDALIDGGPGGAPLIDEGLRALGLQPGDYSSKLRLPLDISMSAGEAVRRIHLALLDTMERNEEGTGRNIDSEFLHDFRVAIRRTRSALSLVDKGVLPAEVIALEKEDFRWLGQQTNRMRDLDVYLIAFPDYKAGLPAEYREALDPFHDHLARQSRRESRKIAALVNSSRYRELRDRWRGYLAGTAASPEHGEDAMRPVKEFAGQRIWKIYRRLMKEGSAIDDASPNVALHELRITGKKLRYLLEFFQSLYPPDQMESLIGPLKKLQNVLGDFQDAEVQSHAIRDFAQEMTEAGSVPVATHMAMGMVADSILRSQDAARSAFHDHFANFSEPMVRKSFLRLSES